MANVERKLPENVPGLFYVDSTCIDCDACRILAPSCFCANREYSIVYRQPSNQTEQFHSLQALVACPTASIGTTLKLDLKEARQSFPIQIEENVYYCGYHSSASYGAASYLVLREEGNLMIDSPRFNRPLVEKLKELGGVRYLLLTHRDDIADHARFQREFLCKRVIHRDELTSETRNAEVIIDGREEVRLSEEIRIIPVPGHTKGHLAFIYKDRYAFTGDHLAYSPELDQLIAFRNACWYSWKELIRSMKRLSNYSFDWVLPGHGRRFHAKSPKMREEMQKCLDWMEKEG